MGSILYLKSMSYVFHKKIADLKPYLVNELGLYQSNLLVIKLVVYSLASCLCFRLERLASTMHKNQKDSIFNSITEGTGLLQYGYIGVMLAHTIDIIFFYSL